MKSKLVIWGAGGHAKVVADSARLMGHAVLGFIDELSPERAGESFYGSIVLTGEEARQLISGDSAVEIALGVGDNESRRKIQNELSALNVLCSTIIHPHSWVSPSSQIGNGVVVMAGAIVQADSKIGDGSVINTASSVDHDSIIGAAVHICPGVRLAGGVRVGDCSFIGAGSVVREKTNIGSGVLIGAGSVVVKDLPDGAIVKGNPARES